MITIRIYCIVIDTYFNKGMSLTICLKKKKKNLIDFKILHKISVKHWYSWWSKSLQNGVGRRNLASVKVYWNLSLPLTFSFSSSGIGHLLWMSIRGQGSSFRVMYVTPRCSWYVSTMALEQTQ